jgi:type I restriction enzyme S subunit
MGSEWPIVQLGEIVDFLPKRYIKKGEIAPFVSMADVPEHSREISNISEKEFSGGGSKFKNGDTIFARITPCLQNGKTAKVSGISSNKVAHGSTEFIVFSSIFPKTDQDFVYYLALDPEFRAYAESRMQGSTGRQRVAWQDLAEYKLNLPPKEVRKNIGLLLASLDNKIELNRQTNQTLEQMAQALFKSWFVDFDPVIDNALAAGKPIPEELQARAQRRQQQLAKPDHQPLPDDVRQLFPSEFEETEALGWVPKGWEVCAFASVAEHIKNNVKPDDIADGDLYFGLEHFTRKSIFLFDGGCGSDVDSNKSAFRKGDLLFGKLRPYFHKVAIAPESGICSTDILVFRSKSVSMTSFMYLTAFSEEFVEYSNLRSTGTRMPRASAKDMLAYKIVKPCSVILGLFENITKPLWERGGKGLQENSHLSKLRDTLLPKLISGELRLPESLLDSETNPPETAYE